VEDIWSKDEIGRTQPRAFACTSVLWVFLVVPGLEFLEQEDVEAKNKPGMMDALDISPYVAKLSCREHKRVAEAAEGIVSPIAGNQGQSSAIYNDAVPPPTAVIKIRIQAPMEPHAIGVRRN